MCLGIPVIRSTKPPTRLHLSPGAASLLRRSGRVLMAFSKHSCLLGTSNQPSPPERHDHIKRDRHGPFRWARDGRPTEAVARGPMPVARSAVLRAAACSISDRCCLDLEERMALAMRVYGIGVRELFLFGVLQLDEVPQTLVVVGLNGAGKVDLRPDLRVFRRGWPTRSAFSRNQGRACPRCARDRGPALHCLRCPRPATKGICRTRGPVIAVQAHPPRTRCP